MLVNIFLEMLNTNLQARVQIQSSNGSLFIAKKPKKNIYICIYKAYFFTFYKHF
jgi:hypothetical protein